MTEAKTVQKRVRPITIRCGTAGCTTKADAVMATTGDDEEIIAPRGWTFLGSLVPSGADVVVGTCPTHSKR